MASGFTAVNGPGVRPRIQTSFTTSPTQTQPDDRRSASSRNNTPTSARPLRSQKTTTPRTVAQSSFASPKSARRAHHLEALDDRSPRESTSLTTSEPAFHSSNTETAQLDRASLLPLHHDGASIGKAAAQLSAVEPSVKAESSTEFEDVSQRQSFTTTHQALLHGEEGSMSPPPRKRARRDGVSKKEPRKSNLTSVTDQHDDSSPKESQTDTPNSVETEISQHRLVPKTDDASTSSNIKSDQEAAKDGSDESTTANGSVRGGRKRQQTHTRTKTGCLTCRARKKKCDEGLPECNNCKEKGYVCQGYAVKRSGLLLAPRVKFQPIARSPTEATAPQRYSQNSLADRSHSHSVEMLGPDEDRQSTWSRPRGSLTSLDEQSEVSSHYERELQSRRQSQTQTQTSISTSQHTHSEAANQSFGASSTRHHSASIPPEEQRILGKRPSESMIIDLDNAIEDLRPAKNKPGRKHATKPASQLSPIYPRPTDWIDHSAALAERNSGPQQQPRPQQSPSQFKSHSYPPVQLQQMSQGRPFGLQQDQHQSQSARLPPIVTSAPGSNQYSQAPPPQKLSNLPSHIQPQQYPGTPSDSATRPGFSTPLSHLPSVSRPPPTSAPQHDQPQKFSPTRGPHETAPPSATTPGFQNLGTPISAPHHGNPHPYPSQLLPALQASSEQQRQSRPPPMAPGPGMQQAPYPLLPAHNLGTPISATASPQRGQQINSPYGSMPRMPAPTSQPQSMPPYQSGPPPPAAHVQQYSGPQGTPIEAPQIRNQRPSVPNVHDPFTFGPPHLSNRERMINKHFYDPFDATLMADRAQCAKLVYNFNEACNPHRELPLDKRMAEFRQILQLQPTHEQTPSQNPPLPIGSGSCGDMVMVESPFACDYGYNITIGNNTMIGANCRMTDTCRIDIGDHVVISANVTLMTGTYAVDHMIRRRELGFATGSGITIGNDAWIGTGAIILPGVTVGERAVVGPGSVVHKDVPPSSIMAGNPAKVVSIIGPDGEASPVTSGGRPGLDRNESSYRTGPPPMPMPPMKEEAPEDKRYNSQARQGSYKR